MKAAILSLILAAVILLPTECSAGPITYDISMNTAPLLGHLAGPFALEFQLNDGSGTSDGNNTAVLSMFMFGGGGALGVPTLTGGVMGDLASSVTLTDNSFFNQFTQQFTPGSQLAFRLALSTNVDAGGIPDQFTFAILDSTRTELPTMASVPLDVLILIDISSVNPAVQVFATDITRSPAAGGDPINIAAPQLVPEPSTVVLISAILCMLVVRKLSRADGPITRRIPFTRSDGRSTSLAPPEPLK